MTRVKICGITNPGDLEAAVEYGADAVGFIGVAASPRYVTPERFAELTAVSPLFVPTVIVVNGREDGERYGAAYVQYYGDRSDPTETPCCNDDKYIRCFRMRGRESLDEIRAYRGHAAAVLLDAYHQDKLGGSGETFNWDLAVEAGRMTRLPIILAGGLTPENVASAVDAVRPYAVDVSSGVESSPGVKDRAKVRAFIRAVRAWDQHQGG
ncbi:MAG: phosphoribosylanthranilate isomerase [Capsulimonadaceae bacterium]